MEKTVENIEEHRNAGAGCLGYLLIFVILIATLIIWNNIAIIWNNNDTWRLENNVNQFIEKDIKVTVKDIEVVKEEASPYRVTFTWSIPKDSKIATLVPPLGKYLYFDDRYLSWSTASVGVIDLTRPSGDFVMSYESEEQMNDGINCITSTDAFRELAKQYVVIHEREEKLEADAQKYNHRKEGEKNE